MKLATLRVIGSAVEVSNNYLGLDEIELSTPHLVDDYREVRYLPRSPAYRTRQRLFQERLEYLRFLSLEDQGSSGNG